MLKVASVTLEVVALAVVVWLLVRHPSDQGPAMWPAAEPTSGAPALAPPL